MRDLLNDPMCRAEDLGVSIPPTPYGVSVCLPLWEHVIGYEEKDPRVVSKFQSGYPRFFIPPLVQELIASSEKRHARAGERAPPKVLPGNSSRLMRPRQFRAENTKLKGHTMKAHNKFTVLYTAQINPKHSVACGWSVHRHDSREGAPTVVCNYMTETEAKAACNELNRISEIAGDCPPQKFHFIPINYSSAIQALVALRGVAA